MKNRPRILPAPETSNHRFWVVPLEGVPHHFRFPSWSVAQVLYDLVAEGQKELGVVGTVPYPTWRRFTPYAASVLGACWHHLGKQLQTEAPGWRATSEDWLDYGALVADELMDGGYVLEEVVDLYNACSGELAKRLHIITRAQERAAFSGGGEVGSPKLTQESPTQPETDATTTSPPSAA